MSHKTRLKEIRERQGLSLRELAKLSGVGLTTLVRLEAADPDFDPRLSTLLNLATALRVTIPTLLGKSTHAPAKGRKGR